MTSRGTTPPGDDATGWIGPAALVLSVVLLGTNWPVLKIALRGTTPLWFSSARLLFAGMLYTLLLAAQRRLMWPPRVEWPIIVVLGVFQSAVMMGLLTVGVSIVGASRSAILAYTMPIWMIPGAALLLGERASRPQLVGLLFGAIGIVTLFNPLDFDWTDRRVILGNAAVLVCALAWSFALLRVRGHAWRVSPMQVMPFQTLLGGVLLLPFAAAMEGRIPRIARSWEFAVSFGYVSIIATFIAFWLVVEAARRLPAARMSLGQLATPVIGVAASALWLGERPGTGSLIGLALILLGVGVSAGFTPVRRP